MLGCLYSPSWNPQNLLILHHFKRSCLTKIGLNQLHAAFSDVLGGVCVCVQKSWSCFLQLTLSAIVFPPKSSLQHSNIANLLQILGTATWFKALLVLTCHYEPAVIITVYLSTALSCTVQFEWKRIESELSLQPREDAVLLTVTKESNAQELKVIKEGGRQMVLLKMKSAGRGSRTSLNIDPQCWGQVELSLGIKGQNDSSPRGRC